MKVQDPRGSVWRTGSSVDTQGSRGVVVNAGGFWGGPVEQPPHAIHGMRSVESLLGTKFWMHRWAVGCKQSWSVVWLHQNVGGLTLGHSQVV